MANTYWIVGPIDTSTSCKIWVESMVVKRSKCGVIALVFMVCLPIVATLRSAFVWAVGRQGKVCAAAIIRIDEQIPH